MAEENKKTTSKMENTEKYNKQKPSTESSKPQNSGSRPAEAYNKNKKTEALVNGRDAPVSTKQAIAICNFIRHKDI